MRFRTEPDHHSQQKAVTDRVAKVVAASAALQAAVAELLTVVANPAQIVMIDPQFTEIEVTPPVTGKPRTYPTTATTEELRKGDQYAELQKELWLKKLGIPPIKEQPEVRPTPVGPHGWVQEVLKVNNIPFHYIEATGDYVLTEHVVTPDVLDMVRDHLGDSGWTVSGQVTGALTDLRHRPDHIRKPSPQRQAESHIRPGQLGRTDLDPQTLQPKSNIPSTFDWREGTEGDNLRKQHPFDGSTGSGGTVKVSVENIPNGG